MKHALSLLFIFFPLLSWGLESETARRDHVLVSIVTEYDEVKNDIKDLKLGLKFKLDDQWHIYWRNPGDSGTIPKVEWQSTAQLKFSEFQWPVPEAIAVTPLLNYGYEGEVILPLSVDVMEMSQKELLITAKAQWLICKVECIPGKANLSVVIPIADKNKISEESNAIYKALSHVPLKKHDIQFKTQQEDETLILTFMSQNIVFDSFQKFYFFPYDGTLIEHAARQEFVVDKDKNLVLRLKKNEAFQNLPNDVQGALTLSRNGEPTVSFEVSSNKRGKMNSSYWGILLFAFLGGMILNLMPCVFPVISIKILSFVQASKITNTKISSHGWAYTVGVLASFLALSGALLSLRSLGENLGWGFQLQSPLFVVFMIFLFYLLGLNLYGFFEIGENLSGIGGDISKGKSLKASFFTGVLATIVATPCTAPFMGTALGVAVTLPVIPSLFVFVMIGAGMAFPYLLLTYSPNLLRYLPKPGAWMVSFKQLLSFAMFATVVWLFWVLSFQISTETLILVGAELLLFSFLIWIIKISKNKKTAMTAVMLVVAFSLFALVKYVYSSPRVELSSVSSKDWNAYSEVEIERLRKDAKPYFIDFTAAWCLTCQVNKKLVLNTDVIQNAFAQKNVKLFRADWTNQDPVITGALEKFNRNSVPLYILFNPTTKREVVLPEILTDDIVLSALEGL